MSGSLSESGSGNPRLTYSIRSLNPASTQATIASSRSTSTLVDGPGRRSTRSPLLIPQRWGETPSSRLVRLVLVLVALTHNLLLLFRETLGREHGMKEEKVERKHAEQLREREEKAAASGRHVAPAQRLLPAVIQLTAQFVRAVRNGILGQLRLTDVLGSVRMAMSAYL